MHATNASPSRVHAADSKEIDAPAATVYRLIADYTSGHPRIVPPQYFRNLTVDEGGYGDGTIIQFDMIAFGSTQHSRSRVTEPEPGRVLVESVLDRDVVTTFTVEPLGATRCRATIATDMAVRSGLLGAIQRWMIRSYLRRVYAAELAQLDRVAREERGRAS